MIALSPGILQRLLQRHGYLINKRYLRHLRNEFGVGALAEKGDIPSVCSAVMVKFSPMLQIIPLS